MLIPNIDLILFSLHLLTENKEKKAIVRKSDLSSTLNITEGSLNVYLSKLSKKGFINRIKQHYQENLLKTFTITETGINQIKSIENIVKDFQFTPERHEISTNISYNEMIKKLNNPLEKIFLLNLYSRKYSFNLNDYLGNIKSANDETNIIGYFKELEKKEDLSTFKPFNIDIFNMSLYGEKSGYDSFISKDLKEEDINSVLITAETFRKQGKFDESKHIYYTILNSQLSISQNHWFISSLGLAQVFRREGKIEDAMDQLESIKNNTKDKLFNAIVNHTLAMYHGFTGDYQECIRILSSCIRSFHNFQMPLFISLSCNSRGVAYYCLNKKTLAEKDWKTARKFAKLSGSSYSEAFILTNLANLESSKGNLKSAEKYLESAKGIFNSRNDLEGLSLIEYNYALYYLKMKERDPAIQHMDLSEIIASPLPCSYEREIRRKEFNQTAYENGLDIQFLI